MLQVAGFQSGRGLFAAVLMLAMAVLNLAGQSAAPAENGQTSAASTKRRIPKTFFRDSSGNLITNNEFVDLRLANPAEKDPAAQRFLENGDVEFTVASPRQERTEAPLFEAPTLDGKLIRTEDLKGKVVVLNFWFIGCPGCMSEIVSLNSLASKFKDNKDVTFIAVAPDAREDIRAFTKQYPFDYELVGSARSILNLFDFKGFPRNIVIGRDGRIAYWRTTVHAWEKFESVIRAELAK
jgi:peroxiredoxin